MYDFSADIADQFDLGSDRVDVGGGAPFSLAAWLPGGMACRWCGDDRMHQFLFFMALVAGLYVLWTIFED